MSSAFMDLKGQEWSEMPTGHKDSYSWNLLWTWSKPKVCVCDDIQSRVLPCFSSLAAAADK